MASIHRYVNRCVNIQPKTKMNESRVDHFFQDERKVCGGFGGKKMKDFETKNMTTLCYGHEKKFVQKVIQWKSLEWLWSEWLESEERVCRLGKSGVMNIFF